MKHAEIKPELWIVKASSSRFWSHAILRVGHMAFRRPSITPTKMVIRQEAEYDLEDMCLLKPSAYHQYGMDQMGDCCRVERTMSDIEMIQMVRGLITLMKFRPLANNAWVAIGGNKYFISDATQSYSFVCSNWGVSCTHSSVGNRKRWPYPTLSLTAWGRPLYPISHVMDLLQRNVDRIADPCVWEKETQHGWLRLTRKAR